MTVSSPKTVLRLFLWISGLGLCCLVIWAYYPRVQFDQRLTFKWEGVIPNKTNYRNVGDSISSCDASLEIPRVTLLRSNEFFSGWSCDKVGSPQAIYSLNYSSQDNELFYCRGESRIEIGQVFQNAEISDLEFLETWQSRPDFVEPTCKFLSHIVTDLHAGKRVLIHCEAGRDRTGAVSALAMGLMWEKTHGGRPIEDAFVKALECDYRKSRSLKPYKYGRIEAFLTRLKKEFGSLSAAQEHFCGQRQ